MKESANSLFHFTKFKYLKKILENKSFTPRYCFESFFGNEETIFAIPMTCFCDIPLSRISEHAIQYNSFGIGLKKEWGELKGLNPVHYVNNKSRVLNLYESFIRGLELAKNDSGHVAIKTSSPQAIGSFFEIACYTKSYRGKIWDSDKNDFKKSEKGEIKIQDFYKEKEWRYIPESSKISSSDLIDIPFVPKFSVEKNGKVQKNKLQKIWDSKKFKNLKFNYYDIKYLIVESNREIKKMSNVIKELKLPISKEVYLISRIITLEQIEEDF